MAHKGRSAKQGETCFPLFYNDKERPLDIEISPSTLYDYVKEVSIEWDEAKNQENQQKHGVSFEEAQVAFGDPQRLIIQDVFHRTTEDRWFCVGDIGTGIVTVR